MKVIIMCGVSGAGKSSWYWYPPECVIVSADHFFDELAEKEGKTYTEVFDFHLLGKAHGECLLSFVESLKQIEWSERRYGQLLSASFITIVVDNTNCTIAEIAPYVALAQAYGAEIEIVRINVEPEVAHERNTHGVPLSGVLNQHAALKNLDKNWPRHWPKIREVSATVSGDLSARDTTTLG